MIKINSVHATNFMSYTDLKLSFSEGLRTIIGKNRVGKSTIFEAVYWCLFGSTARNMKSMRKRNAIDAEVKVIVSGERDGVPFKVLRSVGKSSQKVQIKIQDEVQDAGTIVLNQEIINKFLGISQEMFFASTLFGRHSFRFSQAKDSERKRVFEEMLGLEKYTEAQDRAKTMEAEYEHQINRLKTSIEEAENLMASLDKQKEDETKKSVIDQELKVRTLKTELGEIHKAVAKLQKHKDWPEHDVAEEYEVAHQNVRKFETAIERCEIALAKLKTVKDVCTTCGQKVSKQHVAKCTKEQEAEFKECKAQWDSWIKKMEQLEKSQNLIEEYENFGEQIEDKKKEIAAEESRLKQLKSGKNVTDAQASIERTKTELKTRIKKAKAEITKLEPQYQEAAFWSKGFGRGGVISLLIDSSIEEFNEYLFDTCRDLTDGAISVSFSPIAFLKTTGGAVDRITMEVVIDGITCSYEELSDSERQRVDVCCMLAWANMISNRAESVNFMFFDEIFDTFDAETTEWVFKYIKSKYSDGISVNVISHLEGLKNQSDSSITVVKTQEGSVIQ